MAGLPYSQSVSSTPEDVLSSRSTRPMGNDGIADRHQLVSHRLVSAERFGSVGCGDARRLGTGHDWLVPRRPIDCFVSCLVA